MWFPLVGIKEIRHHNLSLLKIISPDSRGAVCERNCIFAHSYYVYPLHHFTRQYLFISFASMLERQLDGILRDEEKQTPLRLPPSENYR